MADTGFEMRERAPDVAPESTANPGGSLFSPLVAMGFAAVTVAGPWLFTILALLLIAALGRSAGAVTLAMFRVSIIYAFCISLVVSAPVLIVATRVLSDDLYQKRFDRVRPLLVTAMAICMLLAVIAASAVVIILRLTPRPLALATVFANALVAGIWVALTFSGALRQYRAIVVAFLAGLGLAVVSTLLALRAGPAAMVASFGLGLSVILAVLVAKVLAVFEPAPWSLRPAIADLAAAAWQHRFLAVGAFLSAVGIWVDKWIVWASPMGERVSGGLIHAPIYDSPMFVAYLVIIPSLALFMTSLQTAFHDDYQSYYRNIAGHATLAQIQDGSRALQRGTMRILARIMLLHAALCVLVVLTAPQVLEHTGLLYRQIATLRFGALASLFQFLLLSCSTLLLFFDRSVRYALIQAVFVTLQAGLTLLVLRLAPDLLGAGALAASILGGSLAFLVLERTIQDLDYITFVRANAERSVGSK